MAHRAVRARGIDAQRSGHDDAPSRLARRDEAITMNPIRLDLGLDLDPDLDLDLDPDAGAGAGAGADPDPHPGSCSSPCRPAGGAERRSDRRRHRPGQGNGDVRARCAATMIERTLDDGVDLGQIAAGLALSRRQLERDFRRWIGEAPHRYARRLRVIRAVAALGGGAPIAQVALDHGFADQAHFTRTARSMTGQTPGALRRRFRVDPIPTDRCR